eukprot:897690-Prorocentrum_minimum.AAC.1
MVLHGPTPKVPMRVPTYLKVWRQANGRHATGRQTGDFRDIEVLLTAQAPHIRNMATTRGASFQGKGSQTVAKVVRVLPRTW